MNERKKNAGKIIDKTFQEESGNYKYYERKTDEYWILADEIIKINVGVINADSFMEGFPFPISGIFLILLLFFYKCLMNFLFLLIKADLLLTDLPDYWIFA